MLKNLDFVINCFYAGICRTYKKGYIMKNIIKLFCVTTLLLAFSSAFALGVGDSVKVRWQGKYYAAKIISQDDANFRIHYKGYNNSWDEWVSPSRMRIQVRWKNKWYHANALRTSGSRVRIHYKGYGSNWDEWVTLDRIRSR